MNAGGKVRSRHAYRGEHRGRGGRFASKLGMEKGKNRKLVDAFQEMEMEDGKFVVVSPRYQMQDKDFVKRIAKIDMEALGRKGKIAKKCRYEMWKPRYAPRNQKPVLPELE
jgi:hypothetical protein